jgi:hypothetical protein
MLWLSRNRLSGSLVAFTEASRSHVSPGYAAADAIAGRRRLDSRYARQPPLHYRLTKVEPQREFVDETPVGPIVVRVSHLLEPLASGRLRITYAAEIDGPEEQTREIGPMITADFPDTIASLVGLAMERSS